MSSEERNRDASILHVDMDSFFVSVELLDRPSLNGKTVAVAHDSPRSVVTSASYEARKYGVRSAMPTSRAKELCPGLILIPPTMSKYKEMSARIMRIFQSVTPLVEPLSIDEAFLDVSGAKKLLGEPLKIANDLRKSLRADLGLPASVGIANTKFMAKLASSHAKPDGVLLIRGEDNLHFLHSLPITDMWGVGKATANRLKSRAIHTIADLAREPLESLKTIVGKANAEKLHALAWGIDEREVTPHRVEKSIGHENTFSVDLYEKKDIERELLRLCWLTSKRLRELELEAKTVSIKVRFSGFETVTRSRTAEASNSSEYFYATSKDLYENLQAWGRPVRLLGVRAEQLTQSGSSPSLLWSEDEKSRSVDETVDRVHEKFGAAQIKPARLV